MPVIVPDYYCILEVDPYADQVTIEAAFRRLALLFHPDLNHSADSNNRMQLVNEAYTVLHHPGKREKYDREKGLYKPYTGRRSGFGSRPYGHTQPQTGYRPSPRPFTRPQQPQPQAYTKPVPDEQIVVFYLENSAFGLFLNRVQAVIMMQPISSDPDVPSFVEGLIKARGMTVPVIDLRRFLGFQSIPVTKESRIILADIGEQTIGLIIDSVGSFIKLSGDAIELPPAIAVNAHTNFIRGIAKNGFQLIILLEPTNFFSRDQKKCLAF